MVGYCQRVRRREVIAGLFCSRREGLRNELAHLAISPEERFLRTPVSSHATTTRNFGMYGVNSFPRMRPSFHTRFL